MITWTITVCVLLHRLARDVLPEYFFLQITNFAQKVLIDCQNYCDEFNYSGSIVYSSCLVTFQLSQNSLLSGFCGYLAIMKLPIGQSDCRQVSKFLKISIRGEREKKSAMEETKNEERFSEGKGESNFSS